MHVIDQRTFGIIILVLLFTLVVIKRLATGSILEYTTEGNLWVWLTNIFNLFFLLIANPGAAILLITRRLEAVDPTHLAIGMPQLVVGLEVAGLWLYCPGFLLMAWALVRLRGNYQLGGSTPRASDEMVVAGPYRFIRHPMYTAALGISLGLACIVQSLAFFVLFLIYLGLIVALIPIEEEKLRYSYGESYLRYEQKTKRLIPFCY
jgi:protein-S-isoprenylcysteine O-methyltransferase Ste14